MYWGRVSKRTRVSFIAEINVLLLIEMYTRSIRIKKRKELFLSPQLVNASFNHPCDSESLFYYYYELMTL